MIYFRQGRRWCVVFFFPSCPSSQCLLFIDSMLLDKFQQMANLQLAHLNIPSQFWGHNYGPAISTFQGLKLSTLKGNHLSFLLSSLTQVKWGCHPTLFFFNPNLFPPCPIKRSLNWLLKTTRPLEAMSLLSFFSGSLCEANWAIPGACFAYFVIGLQTPWELLHILLPLLKLLSHPFKSSPLMKPPGMPRNVFKPMWILIIFQSCHQSDSGLSSRNMTCFGCVFLYWTNEQYHDDGFSTIVCILLSWKRFTKSKKMQRLPHFSVPQHQRRMLLVKHRQEEMNICNCQKTQPPPT